MIGCVRREREVLRGWRVLFRVDNAAAEHYVNVRYGDVASLETLAERLEEREKQGGARGASRIELSLVELGWAEL